MKLRPFLTALTASAFVLFSTCETLRGLIQEPEVSIKAVDFAGINVNGIDMVARLNVENPNAFAIPFPEIDWELFINEASFVNGALSRDGDLAAGRTSVVDVPFSVSYEGLLNTFTSLFDSREAAYKIGLGVRFPLPLLHEKTFNLDYSGVIPLPKAPLISVGSVTIGKIDFTGVEQNWEFVVDNPNVFPIPFPGMNWDYEVGGVSLIRGSLAGNREVAANSKGTATVKVGLRYADVLQAVAGLASGPENAARADSLMKVDSVVPIPALRTALENAAPLLEIPSTLPIFRKPELSFKGITIRNMAFQRLEFVANWEIDNPNEFSLDMKDFTYNLSVNNSLWAEGALASPSALAPKAKTLLPLEFTVSAVSVIEDIIAIINRGSGVTFSTSGSFNLSGGVPGLENLGILPFDLSGVTRLTR